MPIHFADQTRTFFLTSSGCSYVMKITADGLLVHLHWGRALETCNLDFVLDLRDRPFSPPVSGSGNDCSLDTLPLEYPVYGSGDYRSPALEIYQPADGSRVLDLRYASHRIFKGKERLPGLPATFASADDAETLVITLRDSRLQIGVELYYTIFSSLPALARSAKILNEGGNAVQLRRALSCSIDFSSLRSRFHFLHLSGAWAREREMVSMPLRPGVQSIESRRGASSHQHNPFFAVTELPENETAGEAFGFSLVYSGNFIGLAEVDSHEAIRLQLGLNPFDFSWNLGQGEFFQTPEAIMVYSAEGLGLLSLTYHRLYRDNLSQSKWTKKSRPILVNNWEATYFDFDAEKLEKIAESSAELGMELFVLDDGWFGRRNDDRSSLGDWTVNELKVPGGLGRLGEKIKGMGMGFGLWFEPEMVSPDSELYQKHPDWCLHVQGRDRTLARSQLVLDFSREDVRENVYRQMDALLQSLPICYVKWDMNRNLTEIGSDALPAQNQQEVAHRYVLGVYEFMERITTSFPDVLFEGCAGGGGRFDPGILYYMPQIWTSDNSDAISRLRAQYGTSIVYPWSAISAHVSVTPNHQVGRLTSLKTRADVAFTGAFGYELDVTRFSEIEKAAVKQQIDHYREVRELLRNGDFYRLRSPFQTNEAAWMIVSRDQSEAIVIHIGILAIANAPRHFLPLRGLSETAIYETDDEDERTFSGGALMSIGLPIPTQHGDFVSTHWHLKQTVFRSEQSLIV